MIAQNIQSIHQRIKNACLEYNRNPNEIQLLLATKTVNYPQILAAAQAGELLWGENKVQEGTKKIPYLKHLNPQYHFIGHLQTNKIKEVLQWTTCIQSIDRVELAQKINLFLQKHTPAQPLPVLIQINTSHEPSKFGIHPTQALKLIQEVAQLNYLKINGLMTIGTLTHDTQSIRACFKLLKNIQLQAQQLTLPNNASFQTLSMGMSSDLEIAIQEGSTMLRIGSAIFGNR